MIAASKTLWFPALQCFHLHALESKIKQPCTCAEMRQVLVWKGRRGKKNLHVAAPFFTCSYWHIWLLHFTTRERRITTFCAPWVQRTTHSCCDTCTVWVTSSNLQPGWPQCGRGKSTGSSVSSYWSVQRNGKLKLRGITHARTCWSCCDRLYISSGSSDGVTWISSGTSLEPSSLQLVPQLLSAHFFFFCLILFLEFRSLPALFWAQHFLMFYHDASSETYLHEVPCGDTSWSSHPSHSSLLTRQKLTTLTLVCVCPTWFRLESWRSPVVDNGISGAHLTAMTFGATPVWFLPLPSQRNTVVSIHEVSRTCAEEWDIFFSSSG